MSKLELQRFDLVNLPAGAKTLAELAPDDDIYFSLQIILLRMKRGRMERWNVRLCAAAIPLW